MRLRTALQIAASLVLFTALSTAAAWGAPCGDTAGAGGGDVPCQCGDTVITNTVLAAADPVTTTVCPCDGLIVKSGVKLDLGERTIRGRGLCTGIVLGGDFAADSVAVGRGVVARFGAGVVHSGEGGFNRLHDLQVVDHSGPGVLLFSPRNVIEDCVIARNGDTGIDLYSGNDPPGGGVIQRCRVEDNHGHGIIAGARELVVQSNVVRRNAGRGIHVAGDRGSTVSLNRAEDNGDGIFVFAGNPTGPTAVTRNVALRNRATGLTVSGESILVDRNQSKYNRDAGFDISGIWHTVTLNIAVDNGLDGFMVSAAESTLERNTANYNGALGIGDATAGGGTAGTANTYAANRCTGNELEDSSPPGLCF